jgi:hypothetical protein
MIAWGFWTLDPERDGPRLQLIAELAGAAREDVSAARLLRAMGAEPPRSVSEVRERTLVA